MNPTIRTFILLGASKAGLALTLTLLQAGQKCGAIWNRSRKRCELAKNILPDHHPAMISSDMAQVIQHTLQGDEVHLVIVAVQDDVIAEVARDWLQRWSKERRRLRFMPEKTPATITLCPEPIMIHLSGALRASIMSKSSCSNTVVMGNDSNTAMGNDNNTVMSKSSCSNTVMGMSNDDNTVMSKSNCSNTVVMGNDDNTVMSKSNCSNTAMGNDNNTVMSKSSCSNTVVGNDDNTAMGNDNNTVMSKNSCSNTVVGNDGNTVMGNDDNTVMSKSSNNSCNKSNPGEQRTNSLKNEWTEEPEWRFASLHPLWACADIKASALAFSGQKVSFALECSDITVQKHLHAWVVEFGGLPFHLLAKDKVLYHAAAVMGSNLMVALFDMANHQMQKCGMKQDLATASLYHLAQGALANALRMGCTEALTGPVVRNDFKTVQNHIKALPLPEKRLYRDLTMRLCVMLKKDQHWSSDLETEMEQNEADHPNGQ